MIRRPPRSTLSSSSAASDVYKRQTLPDWMRNQQPGWTSSPGLRASCNIMPGALQCASCTKPGALHGFPPILPPLSQMPDRALPSSLAYISCTLRREASQGEWVTERCAESCVQIRRSALVLKHRPTIHHLGANDRSMPMLYSFEGSLPVVPALRTDPL